MEFCRDNLTLPQLHRWVAAIHAVHYAHSQPYQHVSYEQRATLSLQQMYDWVSSTQRLQACIIRDKNSTYRDYKDIWIILAQTFQQLLRLDAAQSAVASNPGELPNSTPSANTSATTLAQTSADTSANTLAATSADTTAPTLADTTANHPG